MKSFLLVAALTALPLAVSAQQRDTARWGIGAGAAAINSPYAGKDIRIRPVPLLSYEGEKVAARGVDRNMLEDRDDQFDAGFGLSWRGSFGEVQFRALSDITDTSGGQELSLTYSYRMQMGLLTITPQVGVSYLSDDLANYYYGTLDDEVARGVVD